MSSISAFQSGIAGFQSGTNAAAQNTADIARGSQSLEQLTTSLVLLDANYRQVAAAAKVIETSNDLVGTLLDITV